MSVELRLFEFLWTRQNVCTTRHIIHSWYGKVSRYIPILYTCRWMGFHRHVVSAVSNVTLVLGVFEIPRVLFAFEFESERPNGNLATKQSPNYHSTDFIQIWQMEIRWLFVAKLPFGCSDSNSNANRTRGIQSARSWYPRSTVRNYLTRIS